jgi:hypothetical protein
MKDFIRNIRVSIAARDLNSEAANWRAFSAPLTLWTDRRLVNRRDRWGEYIPRHQRREDAPKVFTAPGCGRRKGEVLSYRLLTAHYNGDVTLGLHTTSETNTSLFLVFDIDAHSAGEDGVAVNRAKAERLCRTLVDAGAIPLVEDSDGRGGLHLWVFFSAPLPTLDVFYFGDTIRRSAGAMSVEMFPKQARIAKGRYGNWIRLPGRHHTHCHWSRFMDGRTFPGSGWLAGADACRVLLKVPITPAVVVPPATPPHPTRSRSRRWRSPRSHAPRRNVGSYMATVERGLYDGRNRRAYKIAATLIHDFGLTESACLAELLSWNRDNSPPLEDHVIARIISNAMRYGGRGGME